MCMFVLLVLPSVSAGDFIIRNESNSAQNYFVVNGTNGFTYANLYGTWNGSVNYYNKTELDAFGYFNISDFDINDYFTKTQIESFNYWIYTFDIFNKIYFFILFF